MPPIISIFVSLLITWVALKIALKVTGCLMKLIVFAIALWLIIMALNLSFGFLGLIF